MSQHARSVKMFLSSIRVDGGTQPRSAIDQNIVAEYAESLRAGAKFPPVTVFHDGADHWLGDGFHRFHAHRHAGLDSIAAEIRTGTQRDAVLFSVGANAAHGLRRSNEDKRKAVLTLLHDAEWARWSDREIARRCNVHHETVASVRGSLAKSPVTIGDPESNTGDDRTYTTKHGTTATMDTSGVAKSNQRRKNNSSAREGSAKQDNREAASEPAGPVATPAAGKKKGGDDPGEVESLRAQLAEALDNAEEMAVQLQALTLATDPEHAKRFLEQQQYIRTVERQRDDFQNQVAELKKEVKRLQRKLGMRA